MYTQNPNVYLVRCTSFMFGKWLKVSLIPVAQCVNVRIKIYVHHSHHDQTSTKIECSFRTRTKLYVRSPAICDAKHIFTIYMKIIHSARHAADHKLQKLD